MGMPIYRFDDEHVLADWLDGLSVGVRRVRVSWDGTGLRDLVWFLSMGVSWPFIAMVVDTILYRVGEYVMEVETEAGLVRVVKRGSEYVLEIPEGLKVSAQSIYTPPHELS